MARDEEEVANGTRAVRMMETSFILIGLLKKESLRRVLLPSNLLF